MNMLPLVKQTGVNSPDGRRFDPPQYLRLNSIQQLTEDAVRHCMLNDTRIISLRQGDFWRFTYEDGYFVDYHFPAPEKANFSA